ncbi:MAG: DUF2095 domain-containing protein [Archaeoglobales archaeon]|nr:DUF2095 domain-containing protein [Archaeoglobales archaeon]TDA25990.1 MAG: DUF2095 domain-containing protein [Archaeoglobi archaeon]TDA26287.1 MAG: DUF2095 domain-containing protein [Archaeoglobi archaeon]TDA29117.1 MAG: DUF2095 domain-containing protein [Archaeoglobi archaeon]
MEWEREKFRKMFPNLYQEMGDRVIPNVIDHLEVCQSIEEAIEIIDYFERIGELSKEYASFLKSNPALLNSMIRKRRRGEYESRGLL